MTYLDLPAGLKILAMGSSPAYSRGRIKGAGSLTAVPSPSLLRWFFSFSTRKPRYEIGSLGLLKLRSPAPSGCTRRLSPRGGIGRGVHEQMQIRADRLRVPVQGLECRVQVPAVFQAAHDRSGKAGTLRHVRQAQAPSLANLPHPRSQQREPQGIARGGPTRPIPPGRLARRGRAAPRAIGRRIASMAACCSWDRLGLLLALVIAASPGGVELRKPSRGRSSGDLGRLLPI